MDRREAERFLKRLTELATHRKPFEPVLRYRPSSVERPRYEGLSDPEMKVFESAMEILLSAAFQGNAANILSSMVGRKLAARI